MDLTQLGNKVAPPASPDEAVLETVDTDKAFKNASVDEIWRTVVRFSCPEFTSLCPVTGQPDFARIYIDYIPRKKIVESKSMKLFLTSFRNHGAFHEACTLYIGTRLVKTLDPIWLRIVGIWFPRGGIPLDIFWQTGAPPKGVYIPEVKVPMYEGR